jgi:hypothetical protein
MFTTLNKHWRKLLVLGAVVVLMAGEAIFLTADHWWKALSGARVTYEGQSSAGSAVYRSQDGSILIRLQEKGGPSLYLVDPLRRIVGMPSPTRFVFLPGYSYSREVPPVYSRMQSVKIEVDPQLVIEQRAIEFNSFEKGRVRIAW